MISKTNGIAEWSKLYGREITNDEYTEISSNLTNLFELLHEGNNSMYKERLADIRNKLQPSITILQLLKQGKPIPANLIDLAIEDLDKVIKVIDKDEVA